ncbi:MAG: hypothetical protein AAFR03_13170 [Pseudomonadota bacterium]
MSSVFIDPSAIVFVSISYETNNAILDAIQSRMKSLSAAIEAPHLIVDSARHTDGQFSAKEVDARLSALTARSYLVAGAPLEGALSYAVLSLLLNGLDIFVPVDQVVALEAAHTHTCLQRLKNSGATLITFKQAILELSIVGGGKKLTSLLRNG